MLLNKMFTLLIMIKMIRINIHIVIHKRGQVEIIQDSMLRSNCNQVVKAKEKSLEEMSILLLLKESPYHQRYQNYQTSTTRRIILIYKRYKIPRIEGRTVLLRRKILSEIRKVNLILLSFILKMSYQQEINSCHKDKSVEYLHRTLNLVKSCREKCNASSTTKLLRSIKHS